MIEKEILKKHHNHGFYRDMSALLGRRQFLGLTTGLGLSLMALPAFAKDCISLPWETAGPYPADGSNRKNGKIVNALQQSGIIRSDLRSSFGDFSGTADGVKLDLDLTLQNAQDCTPLTGHAIYIWACDAGGLYSLYNILDQNYLRGMGITDESGKVKFTTIFPGCYDGRWPHLHFEIFKNPESAITGETSLLTAQIALPEKECSDIYAEDARYKKSINNLKRITLKTDNVFSNNTPVQITQQTLSLKGDRNTGYSGKLSIPVDFNADRHVDMGPPPYFFDIRKWFWPW